jgi:hypothetical protein
MNSVERLCDMFDQTMVDNVEKAWMHLKASMEMLNKAEHMHESVMRFHDPEYMYLTTTAEMSRGMVCQMWDLAMEAQTDLGWALESLLNGCQSTLDEEV